MTSLHHMLTHPFSWGLEEALGPAWACSAPALGSPYQHGRSSHRALPRLPPVLLSAAQAPDLSVLWAHLSQAWSTPGTAPQHHGPPPWSAHPWSAARGSWETHTANCTLPTAPRLAPGQYCGLNLSSSLGCPTTASRPEHGCGKGAVKGTRRPQLWTPCSSKAKT